MDEQPLMDALTKWCAPELAASVRAAGLRHVERSLAEVAAVRTIYERRRRRAGLDSALLPQVDGVLRALESANGQEIVMLHVVANNGREAIVFADLAEIPLLAFEITQNRE